MDGIRFDISVTLDHLLMSQEFHGRDCIWCRLMGRDRSFTGNSTTMTSNDISAAMIPMKPMINKRALLVGINYTGSAHELNGCINDAKTVGSMLASMYGVSDMRYVTDDSAYQPTRSTIIEGLHWLVDGTKEGDVLFFHFSGHGTHGPDMNGDEDDGRDEAMVSVDMMALSDDWMYEWLHANVPKGVTLFCTIDACHSGTMLDLGLVYPTVSRRRRQTWKAGTVVCISASLDSEQATDVTTNSDSFGIFTHHLNRSMQLMSQNASLYDIAQNVRVSTLPYNQTPCVSVRSARVDGSKMLHLPLADVLGL